MLFYLPAPLRALALKHSRFFRFAVVGTFSTLVDFAIFFTLYYLGINLVVSNIIAYSLSLIGSFFINRYWTFADSKHRNAKRLPLAILYGYIGLGLSTCLVWLWAQIIPVFFAKICTVLIMLFVNYGANKYIIFRTQD